MGEKAVVIAAPGGPEQLKLVDVDVGAPGPGEIRIRHHACGLNYIDVYHRNGAYALPLRLNILVAIAASVATGLAMEAADRVRARASAKEVP